MTNRLTNRLTTRMSTRTPTPTAVIRPWRHSKRVRRCRRGHWLRRSATATAAAVLAAFAVSLATPAVAQQEAKGGKDPAGGSRAASSSGPPIDLLCAAAVTQALAEPERARSFLSRARLAGWLPEVRFRAYRRFARTEGLSFDDTGTGGVVAPVDISAIDDVRYEWRATLDLSRIVFNPDELQAHSEALRMSDVRRDIQALVIRLYFERRRLLLESTTTPAAPPPGEGASVELRVVRVAEIEAQLDALSGGAFSGWDSGRREAAPGP